MTTVEILEEQKRLDIYLKQQRDNLPQAIYADDAGVERANKRLKELSVLLDEHTKLSKVAELKVTKMLEESKVLADKLNADLKKVYESLEEMLPQLHNSFRPRYHELKQELGRLVR